MGGFRIAVAGCGIAGLAIALLLDRQGHRVTLFERFEVPRALGSGLMIQPTGMAVLGELGLAQDLFAHGAPISRILGRNGFGELVLDARYADLRLPGVVGLGVHRDSLFGTLFDAVASSGVEMVTGHEVSGTELHEDGRRLLFANQDSSDPYNLVIDALGVASPLAESANGWLPFGALWATLEWKDGGSFQPDWLEQRYELARRMAGILPTGKRRGSGETNWRCSGPCERISWRSGKDAVLRRGRKSSSSSGHSAKVCSIR
jgi:2-polyprenyl-6-methoxyphenol hydroxylase-like FAD-dependent oxidoreductase